MTDRPIPNSDDESFDQLNEVNRDEVNLELDSERKEKQKIIAQAAKLISFIEAEDKNLNIIDGLKPIDKDINTLNSLLQSLEKLSALTRTVESCIYIFIQQNVLIFYEYYDHLT